MGVSNTRLAVAALIAATVASLVFFHAERNKIRRPFAWASGVFLFLGIALPAYIIHVRRVRKSRAL